MEHFTGWMLFLLPREQEHIKLLSAAGSEKALFLLKTKNGCRQ